MFPEIPVEQLRATLDALALQQLEIAFVEAPPVDAFHLAERLGLLIARDDRLTNRARLVRLSVEGHARPSIMLAPEPRAERRHWSVAHEIGEHLAAEACYRLGIDAVELPPNGREQIANLLASRLLLPAEWFFPDAREQRWDLLALKQIYATASHELIARRMLDGAPGAIVSVWDHDRLTWRRSNLPGRIPPPRLEEVETRRAAHATGETAIDGAATAWAIHEPDWKREIVRVEIDEFDADVVL